LSLQLPDRRRRAVPSEQAASELGDELPLGEMGERPNPVGDGAAPVRPLHQNLGGPGSAMVPIWLASGLFAAPQPSRDD
jgi:hypothetical protein